MRGIYHIRCQELPLKGNFPHLYGDKKCISSLCTEEESQQHLFESKCFSTNNTIIQQNIKYSDIFGDNIGIQRAIMRIMFHKMKNRKEYMTLFNRGFPSDPSMTLPKSFGIKKARKTLKNSKQNG